MSRLETNEILLDYATILTKQNAIVKEAWTWRDIVTELGIGAAVDAGVAAGAIAGAGAGFLPASLLPAGAAYTASAGALPALAAAGLGPIGVAVLAGAALTLGIWYLTRQMDDNLDDLIDRLEDLDPNDAAAPKVQAWIEQLKAFKPILELPPTTTDLQERVRMNTQKYMAMKQVHAYMKQMLAEWPTVKQNLTDWGWDDSQAEHALQLTTQTIGQAVEQAKAKAQQVAQEALNELQKHTKIDYRGLAKEINDLYTKLTSLSGGKPPTFDTDAEKAAWSVAQRLLGKEQGEAPLTQQEVMATTKPMQDLKALLGRGIEMMSAQPAAQKAGSLLPPISKRALTLGDGRKVSPKGTVSPVSKQKGKPGKGPAKQKGDPMIRGLQSVINQINTALNSGAGVVREDGIYGPVTADALVGAISSDWRLQQEVAERAKVGFEALQDVQQMRQRPQLLKSVYRVLAPIARNLSRQNMETGMAGLGPTKPISQRQITPGRAVPRGYKERPIQDQELLTYRMLHDW